ncbi:hypothetical protein A8C56_13790 [Niabella ginsenosidivorans]|uniref:DUF72 domain-containing protein n=1 Tax=Niabella ginsenosidivorans TaxID=1176587 RepID=A0A1A9I2Z9_9BACT|nr:DUF72 domain-containing protein [Niabella ginsenosidivorans]ANH81903.1 hypothetical protein A8C56_13790 [Niabella ginsenosidivorans]
MAKGTINIGTSGWHYRHWKKVFYPDTVRNEDQLNYYAQVFRTVEINNSFYRLPAAETFSAWAAAVPGNFLFAVKGSRFFTHMKKLNLGKKDLQPFFTHIKHLKKKLGPVLFQLPPAWKVNAERLEGFLKILPRKYRYSFEFRNATWYNEQVYALLKKYNCAFCIYDLNRQTSPLITTADFVYIRLHGPAGKYQGKYTASMLETWAKKCRKWQAEELDVYLYFDNDQAGYAVQNAGALSGKLL